MRLFETIFLAISTLLSNKIRSFLILLSVAIGVFAIFLAGSLSDSVDSTVEEQLYNLGENVFIFKRIPSGGFGGSKWWKYKSRPKFVLDDLTEIKKQIGGKAFVSGFSQDAANVVKSDYSSSQPDITVAGIDENYFKNYSRELEIGRGISASDIDAKNNVAVIGLDVIKKVFPYANPIGEKLRIKSQEYEIIGILKEKGAVLGNSQDNLVLIPLTNYTKYFTNSWVGIDISINPISKENASSILDESIGIMRSIRNLSPYSQNNFEVETNEALTDKFSNLRDTIKIFGALVGIFTLIAAGIGITNIMLITVKERTREIGVRKALGAKNRWILLQFIIETVTICQIGAIIGVSVAITLGKAFAGYFDFIFDINPFWLILSVLITSILGLLSGYYPARKASKLNPIDALRYE